MSRDNVEGFLVGLGAGVLLAAFMKFRKSPGEHSADRPDDAAEGLEGPRDIPTNAIADAARAG